MKSEKPSLSNRSARVLLFRRGQAPPRGIEADPVRDLAEYHDRDQGADNYRHRMVVNLAAFILVVALITTGLWLADTMARMRKNQDCVLSGRRGCTPVTVTPKDRWLEPLVQPSRP